MNQRWHDSESMPRPRQIQGSELEDEFDRMVARMVTMTNHSSIAVASGRDKILFSALFQKVPERY